jgi:hypothetical protein
VRLKSKAENDVANGKFSTHAGVPGAKQIRVGEEQKVGV